MVAGLLSGRRLAANTAWHLSGSGLPLLVAVLAIPQLIQRIGTERFGLLTIVWMVVGYMSLFDLGVGRALTKFSAELLGQGRDEEVSMLARTGLQLMLLLGLFAGGCVAASAHWLATDLLNISPALHEETLQSLLILSLAIPFVIHSAGLVGLLQAYQRAAAINVVRLPLGLMNFIGPVIAAQISPTLTAVTSALVLSRVLAWLAYWYLVRPLCGSRRNWWRMDRSFARGLIGFGGWVTVSGVISPLMVSFDRVLIGAVLSVAVVSFYTVPQEIISRLSIVPAALSAVFFPALTSALWANLDRARSLFDTMAQVSAAVMFIPIAAIVLFAQEGLNLWLGSEFAEHSSGLLRIVAIGMFINTMAQLPYHALHARGFPDLTAKLHVAELPLYGLLLWYLVLSHGLVGAAVAWTARATADAAALYVMAWRRIPQLRVQCRAALAMMVLASLLLISLMKFETLWLKTAVGTALTVVSGWLALRALILLIRQRDDVAATAV